MTDLAPKIEDKQKVILTVKAEVKPQYSSVLLTWSALGAAALLTVIYGRSVVFNIGGGVLGGGIDGYENMWNDWWVQKALSEFRNPFFTDYIYYANGTSLRFHTLHPSTGILAAPLWWLFGGAVSTNLVFLLSLCFTCFFGFLLIRDVLLASPKSAENKLWTNVAAFVGAAIFTFANGQVIGFFGAGQTEKLSAQWLPLYFLLLFRALNRPQWQLYCALSILSLVLLALTDWQYTLYAVLATLLYFIFLLFTRRTLREKAIILGKLSLIGGIFGASIFFPLVLPMINEANNSPWLSVSEQARFNSKDILDFVSLSLDNPGYIALALVIIGIISAWKVAEGARFWLIAGLSAAVMSLGPKLFVGGTQTDLALPYSLLYKLPVLSAGRDPQRFYTLAMLAFGVLAAFGLVYLLGLVAKANLPAKKLFSGGLVGAILVGSLYGFVAESGKAQVYPLNPTPFYQQLRQDKNQYAILELPTFSDESEWQDKDMGFGTLHQKQRFGGRMARDHKLSNPNNFTKNVLLFRDLFYLSSVQSQIELFRPKRDIVPTPDFAKIGLPLLNYYNTRYIVLYNLAIGRKLNSDILNFLTQVYGGTLPPLHYEDGFMRVFKVPEVAPLPSTQAVILDIGRGWYAAETDGTNVWRWADSTDGQSAEIFLPNLSKERQKRTISFKALTFVPEGGKQPRTINVAINGYALAQIPFPEYGQEKELEIMIDVPPGVNIITFTSPEAALPANKDKTVDGRMLSFRLAEVKMK
jgi:hypothetical protein